MISLSQLLINKRITEGAASSMTNKEFLERELEQFMTGQTRRWMLDGEKYYEGRHDILLKRRCVTDPDTGKKTDLKNLPNSKIVDNQYRKMVNQKKNYLLGKPFTVSADNEAYAEALNSIFTRRVKRMIKNLYGDALNGGIGWLYIGYDAEGELTLQKFKPYEVKPFWSDSEHTILDSAIRVYPVYQYSGTKEQKIYKVEVFDHDGITYYERAETGKLIQCEPFHQNYMTISVDDNEQGYNWSRIPLIAFKYNESEMPLIRSIKSLQDGINLIESTFEDNMQEDARNTIIVLVNYDGENLAEFRENVAKFGAIKVRSGEGGGDVKTLQVEVKAENYKAILKLFKDALIENAMGYDAKDDRLSGNPNRMNIQSMYSDIDLDADETEAEFQAAFEELMWFIDCHLANSGQGDFSKEAVTFTFDRNTMINESETINDIKNSVGLISTRTLLEKHPYVTDVDAELERMEEEKKAELDSFGLDIDNNDDDNDDE